MNSPRRTMRTSPNSKPRESPSKKRKRDKSPTLSEQSLAYFEFVEDKNEKRMYRCKICSEDAKTVNGTKPSNLTSHLQRMHTSFFNEKIAKRVKESLPMKRLRLLQNAVEIVTVNGRPFNSLLDSGYQAGIQNKLRKLRSAGIGVDFSQRNLPDVKKHLAKMAENVRTKIRQELNGKIMCIMVDICTKNNRSIYGISAQFIFEGNLKIRCLGMIELEESHTGEYLAGVLVERLAKFGIEKWQILCITTDNGKNVVKMIRDFNQMVVTSSNNNDIHSNIVKRALLHEFNTSEEVTDQEIQRMINEPDEMTDDEAFDMIFYEQQLEAHENILATVSSEIIGTDMIWNTTGVNCSAHTLQLAIYDARKMLDRCHDNVIEIARRVAKFLKNNSTHREIIKEGVNYKLPRLECKTRWGSTCLMVSINFNI